MLSGYANPHVEASLALKGLYDRGHLYRLWPRTETYQYRICHTGASISVHVARAIECTQSSVGRIAVPEQVQRNEAGRAQPASSRTISLPSPARYREHSWLSARSAFRVTRSRTALAGRTRSCFRPLVRHPAVPAANRSAGRLPRAPQDAGTRQGVIGLPEIPQPQLRRNVLRPPGSRRDGGASDSKKDIMAM